MDCPYKSIGLIKDRCMGRCKPLESTYAYSGLSYSEIMYSVRNIMLSYAAIGLSDIARDGGLVRSFASRLRNKVGKLLPEELNQYIMTADKKIAIAEQSNASLEQYLYTSGQIGSSIFNLATPPKPSYNRAFVAEVGSLSSQLMIMGDMKTDLRKDVMSGGYNPLKEQENHSKFIELYTNAKGRLVSLMKTAGTLFSDKKGIIDCYTDALICGLIGYVFAAPPTLYYLKNNYWCCGFETPKPISYIDAWRVVYSNLNIAINNFFTADCCILPVLLCFCGPKGGIDDENSSPLDIS